MTSRQWRAVAVLTAAVIAVAVLTITAEHWRGNDAVIPQDVVTRNPQPTTRPKETVPRFTSCAAARQAGVRLPLQAGDPGWNPRLDRNGDGRAC